MPNMRPLLLEFEGVVVERGEQRILGPVDLSIPASGITVLAGASGAGKTTLLRLGNGLDVPSRGVIRYRGQDLAQFDVLRLRREVGMACAGRRFGASPSARLRPERPPPSSPARWGAHPVTARRARRGMQRWQLIPALHGASSLGFCPASG